MTPPHCSTEPDSPASRGYIRQYKIHTTSPIDGRVVTQYPHDRSADRGSEDFRKVALELFANRAK